MKRDTKTGTKWKRHAVTVPNITRSIDCFKRTKDGVKRVAWSEMVQMFDVSKRVVNGKVLKQRWHRGAKVGI